MTTTAPAVPSRTVSRRDAVIALGAVGGIGGLLGVRGARAASPAAGGVCGAKLPPQLALDFDVQAVWHGFKFHGRNALRFTRDGARYELVGTTRAAGIYEAVYESRGTIVNETLVPTEYVERKSGKTAAQTRLDWASGRIAFGNGGPNGSTAARMQDRLSLLLQLGWFWRLTPAASQLTIPVAGTGHASDYRFARQGDEELVIGNTRLRTIRIEREDDGDDRIEIWLAPGRCWLPARVRFVDGKGNSIDQRLRG